MTRMAASLLVVALLWAQLLGLVHQEIHPGPPSNAHQSIQATPSAVHAVLERLLGHHDDGIHAADCRLYDQLSHADSLPTQVPVLLLPPLSPVVFVASLASRVWLPNQAWFDARGPPNLCCV